MGQKATHLGTCQICQRVQKLPNGLLAKHGYNVYDGWFNGVCFGAGNLPYEESCELLKEWLILLQERCTKQEQRRDELLKPATSPKVRIRVYGSRFGPVWEFCELREKNGMILAYDDKDKIIDFRLGNQSDFYNLNTIPEIATVLNKKLANSIDQDVRKLVCEIQQVDRLIIIWKVRPLVPIEAKAL